MGLGRATKEVGQWGVWQCGLGHACRQIGPGSMGGSRAQSSPAQSSRSGQAQRLVSAARLCRHADLKVIEWMPENDQRISARTTLKYGNI